MFKKNHFYISILLMLFYFKNSYCSVKNAEYFYNKDYTITNNVNYKFFQGVT